MSLKLAFADMTSAATVLSGPAPAGLGAARPGPAPAGQWSLSDVSSGGAGAGPGPSGTAPQASASPKKYLQRCAAQGCRCRGHALAGVD